MLKLHIALFLALTLVWCAWRLTCLSLLLLLFRVCLYRGCILRQMRRWIIQHRNRSALFCCCEKMGIQGVLMGAERWVGELWAHISRGLLSSAQCHGLLDYTDWKLWHFRRQHSFCLHLVRIGDILRICRCACVGMTDGVCTPFSKYFVLCLGVCFTQNSRMFVRYFSCRIPILIPGLFWILVGVEAWFRSLQNFKNYFTTGYVHFHHGNSDLRKPKPTTSFGFISSMRRLIW